MVHPRIVSAKEMTQKGAGHVMKTKHVIRGLGH